MTTKPIKNWLLPACLLLLGSINVLSGAFQLGTIQQGPSDVADAMASAQYFETPIPIVLHIVGGILFNLLGPLQFAPGLLKRRPRWHRLSGRLLVVSGFFVAGTGIWMNHFFPQYGTFLKYPGILVNSLGLAVSLTLALQAIRSKERDIQKHRRWMARAVAFGLGPATQRVFILPIFFVYGMEAISDLTIGVVIWVGFLANLAVVEWVFWRESRKNFDQHQPRLKEAMTTK